MVTILNVRQHSVGKNKKTIAHTEEAAKLMGKRFCNHVFWLRVVRHEFSELFENEKSKILMEKTAPSFFADLNRILHSYLLLEFVKITDSATNMSKGQDNFTVDNLIASIKWPQDVLEKLRSLSSKARTFRRRILDARNKLLAHADKEIILKETTLGEFPEGDDEAFLRTLQEICNVAHELCFGLIFGQIKVVKPGDVVSFKRALANAVAFHELYSESKGQGYLPICRKQYQERRLKTARTENSKPDGLVCAAHIVLISNGNP